MCFIFKLTMWPYRDAKYFQLEELYSGFGIWYLNRCQFPSRVDSGQIYRQYTFEDEEF